MKTETKKKGVACSMVETVEDRDRDHADVPARAHLRSLVIMQRPAKRMRPLFRVNVRRAVEMRWTIPDKMSSPYPQFSCMGRRLHLQTVCVSEV